MTDTTRRCPCGRALSVRQNQFCSRECSGRAASASRITHGLTQERSYTCPCGQTFTSSNPGARYCTDECRKRLGRYGRSYGHIEPRQFGPWRSDYSA